MAHGLEFLLSVLQPVLQVVDRAARIFEVEPSILPGLLVLLQLHPAVSPEIDLLAQAVMDSGQCLIYVGHATIRDLLEVRGDQNRRRQG